MPGLIPVIDVDALEQEPLEQSPVSTGSGTGINLRQAIKFKRFSAMLSVSLGLCCDAPALDADSLQAEAAAAAVDAAAASAAAVDADVSNYLPRRTSFSKNSSPAVAAAAAAAADQGVESASGDAE